MDQQARPIQRAPGMRKFNAKYLRQFGFEARTVFDIGVLEGTPPIYRTFGDRKLVLIDPLPDLEGGIRVRWPTLDFDFHEVALGSAPGSTTLHVYDQPGRSGMLERTVMADCPARSVKVPMTTLDNIIAKHGYLPPYGIKLDTEGYELEILKGATETLRRTEFIVAETCIKKRFQGGYRFSEIVCFLAEHGLELADILTWRPQPPWFLDCLFMRSDSQIFDVPSLADYAGSSVLQSTVMTAVPLRGEAQVSRT